MDQSSYQDLSVPPASAGKRMNGEKPFKPPLPLQEFLQFPLLVAELRSMVWEAAVFPRTLAIRRRTRDGREEEMPSKGRFTCYNARIPAIFHVCKESREVALRHFHVIFQGSCALYFNPALDTLYLPFDPKVYSAHLFFSDACRPYSDLLKSFILDHKNSGIDKIRKFAYDEVESIEKVYKLPYASQQKVHIPLGTVKLLPSLEECQLVILESLTHHWFETGDNVLYDSDNLPCSQDMKTCLKEVWESENRKSSEERATPRFRKSGRQSDGEVRISPQFRIMGRMSGWGPRRGRWEIDDADFQFIRPTFGMSVGGG